MTQGYPIDIQIQGVPSGNHFCNAILTAVSALQAGELPLSKVMSDFNQRFKVAKILDQQLAQLPMLPYSKGLSDSKQLDNFALHLQSLAKMHFGNNRVRIRIDRASQKPLQSKDVNRYYRFQHFSSGNSGVDASSENSRLGSFSRGA